MFNLEGKTFFIEYYNFYYWIRTLHTRGVNGIWLITDDYEHNNTLKNILFF